MFKVHKQGYIPNSPLTGGLLPYDFFCEDQPSLNLFVFTHAGLGVEQTLWGFSRLERFEAMVATFKASGQVWQSHVNVLTGPSRNGTDGVRFEDVAQVWRLAPAAGERPAYAVHSRAGEVYYTHPGEQQGAAELIYQAE